MLHHLVSAPQTECLETTMRRTHGSCMTDPTMPGPSKGRDTILSRNLDSVPLQDTTNPTPMVWAFSSRIAPLFMSPSVTSRLRSIPVIHTGGLRERIQTPTITQSIPRTQSVGMTIRGTRIDQRDKPDMEVTPTPCLHKALYLSHIYQTRQGPDFCRSVFLISTAMTVALQIISLKGASSMETLYGTYSTRLRNQSPRLVPQNMHFQGGTATVCVTSCCTTSHHPIPTEPSERQGFPVSIVLSSPSLERLVTCIMRAGLSRRMSPVLDSDMTLCQPSLLLAQTCRMYCFVSNAVQCLA